MKNVTLSLDEETLEACRIYVERHQTSLDALVRDLLHKVVVDDRRAAVVEMFRLMDDHPGNSHGQRWTREDLYVDFPGVKNPLQ